MAKNKDLAKLTKNESCFQLIFGYCVMPPRKTKARTEKSETVDEQVTAMDIAGKENNQQELSSSIRMMREEISGVIDKLQPQLNALKEDVSVCSRKIGDVEEAFCNMDSRITKLETANKLLRKENDELKEKAAGKPQQKIQPTSVWPNYRYRKGESYKLYVLTLSGAV